MVLTFDVLTFRTFCRMCYNIVEQLTESMERPQETAQQQNLMVIAYENLATTDGTQIHPIKSRTLPHEAPQAPLDCSTTESANMNQFYKVA